MTWEFKDFDNSFLSVQEQECINLFDNFWHYYTFLTVLRIYIFFDIFDSFWKVLDSFWQFLTIFIDIFLTFFFDIFLTFFWHFFDIFLTFFLTFFFDIFLTFFLTFFWPTTDQPTDIQNLDVEAPSPELKKDTILTNLTFSHFLSLKNERLTFDINDF